MAKTYTSVRTKQNLFDPKTIKVSSTITRLDRFKLLFRRSLFSFDISDDGSATMTRYKKMNGIIYVLNVQHTKPKNLDKEQR